MSPMRTLTVGIAPYKNRKKRALTLNPYKPSVTRPKVWFNSIESLAQILSSPNRLLLQLIAHAKPNSMTELAQLSGRQKSNLSRTLRTLQRYRVVVLNRGKRGRIIPRLGCKRLRLDVDLDLPS